MEDKRREGEMGKKELLLIRILRNIFPLYRVKDGKLWLSGSVLVVSNLIPLFGVLFLNWEPWLIIILYWTESGIIGIYNIFKILLSGMFNREKQFSPSGIFAGLFFSIFFLVHYGIFMFCHGFLIITIITGVFGTVDTSYTSTAAGHIDALLSLLFDKTSVIPVSRFMNEFVTLSVLFLSHGISFCMHFIKEKRIFTTWPADYMTEPYRRIIVMQVTGIAGILLLALTGWQAGIIVLWVIIKIITDLRAHVKSKVNDTVIPCPASGFIES
ncbi:MAG: hypothetical protein JXB88_11875 [Spirochaetales bacterium]|nr:hypothetical protein [Spirochaetales bacterium]